MDLNNDFVNEEEEIELIVHDRKFRFRPTTGGTETKWFKQYMKVDQESGEIICDHETLNTLKLQRITYVPYGKDIIKNWIGVEKEFADLNQTQRVAFLSKLNKKIYDKLLKEMDNFQNGDEKQKKN